MNQIKLVYGKAELTISTSGYSTPEAQADLDALIGIIIRRTRSADGIKIYETKTTTTTKEL